MSTPPPDPTGRPNPPKPPAPSGSGSTGSHRLDNPEASLSDLLRAGPGSSRRVAPAANVAAHIVNNTPPPSDDALVPPENTDDSPTVITPGGAALHKNPPPPPPPYVLGEGPSIAGRRLGHFELIEAVGSGGMAAVLKARDLELGREVALKILPPEAAIDSENVTRFKQEARAAAKLDHENVARVYFCGEDQGLHFIAFEFVEGVTLRQLLDRRGPLPAAECVRYMIQVAAGLNHAAERHVVHRDIKPSNIIITPDGRAKIVDMGLARHIDSHTVNGGVTQSGVTLGTFDYISPEQALDPRRADVRSDIYSLGCAFYHAMTGRPPVPEGTAAKKLHAHQHVAPTDPRQLNPTIPDEVAAVLARMMAKDPDRRYQSPVELIAHLKGVSERLQLTLDLTTDSAVQAVPADRDVLPTVPRLPLGWVIAIAAVAIAVTAIVLSGNGSGPPPSRVGQDTTNRPAKETPPPGTVVPPPPRPDPPNKGTQPPPVQPTPPDPRVIPTIRTAEELARAMAAAEPTGETRLRLAAGVFDLTTLPAITLACKRLELIGPDLGAARIVVNARSSTGIADPPGSVTLRAEVVSLRGVWFDINLPGGGSGNADGVVIEAGKVTMTDCTFLYNASASGREVAALRFLPTSVDRSPAPVRIERTVFGPGGVGVRVSPTTGPGPALDVEDSGFASVTAAIQFTHGAGASPGSPPTLRCSRCSFILDSAAAAVDVGTLVVPISAGYCVFGPSIGTGFVVPLFGPTQRATVVRVRGVKPDAVRFEGITGQKNAYYRVDAVACDDRTYSPEECKELTRGRFDDLGRVELRQQPWDAAEGGVLAPFASAEPARAFRLRVTRNADPDLFLEGGPARILGAQFSPEPLARAGRAYAASGADPGVEGWPPPNPARAASIRQKVWRPRESDDTPLPTGEYANLVKLLQDARAGDTILIRADGDVPVIPVTIQSPGRPSGEPGGFRLTFKPYPGCRPVLRPGVVGNRVNVSLFRIEDGDITFDGVEFVVKADRSGEKDLVSAVTLIGGRGCRFMNCVFTLNDEGVRDTAAAVVMADPSGLMRMESGMKGAPEVRFENCLVRGKGSGVWVTDSRPVRIDLTNTVTGIFGPVVSFRGVGKDPGFSPRSRLTLTRSTLLLGGPAVESYGRAAQAKAPGVVPVDVTADACLFAAVPNVGRPLVELALDGLDPDNVARGEEQSPLSWQGKGANRYANFPDPPVVTLIKPGGDRVTEWGWDDWFKFTGESDRLTGVVTFEAGPSSGAELANLKPDAARVTDPKPVDAGADVSTVARPDDPTTPDE